MRITTTRRTRDRDARRLAAPEEASRRSSMWRCRHADWAARVRIPRRCPQPHAPVGHGCAGPRGGTRPAGFSDLEPVDRREAVRVPNGRSARAIDRHQHGTVRRNSTGRQVFDQDSWVVRLRARSSRDQPDCSAFVATDQISTVRGVGQGRDSHIVSEESPQPFPRLRVPQADRGIGARRGQRHTIR